MQCAIAVTGLMVPTRRAALSLSLPQLAENQPMANADQNDLRKSHIEETRNQRREPPIQPGASGRDPGEPMGEEKAREAATKTYGKTQKNDG